MRTPAWRLIAYAMIILAGVMTALPNLLTQSQLDLLPSWLPKQRVALGLDLRGGAHLVLEVDSKALIAERVQDLMREARRALREAKVDPQSVRRDGNAVIVTLADAAARPQALQALKTLAGTPAFGEAPEVDVTGVGPLEA